MQILCILKNMNWRIFNGDEWSVMNNGRYTGDKVFVESPGSTEILRNIQYSLNMIPEYVVNLFAPFGVVVVSICSQGLKTIEIKMIMGIDKTRNRHCLSEMKNKVIACRNLLPYGFNMPLINRNMDGPSVACIDQIIQ